MAMQSKKEMLDSLRAMLADVFQKRREGAPASKLARAHGYVDGFMRALLDAGVVERSELLGLVAEQRASLDGPATRAVEPEAPSSVEATAA
jgi:hypothetical protein